jgi:hypothetical protein
MLSKKEIETCELALVRNLHMEDGKNTACDFCDSRIYYNQAHITGVTALVEGFGPKEI